MGVGLRVCVYVCVWIWVCRCEQAPLELHLKKGTPVMILDNLDVVNGLVNGSRGGSGGI